MDFSQHVIGHKKYNSKTAFINFLSMMQELCTQEAYVAMDEKNAYFLSKIYNMEKYILIHKSEDERLVQFLDYINNLKNTYYVSDFAF